ncbi:MAG TPA: GntR family transcriptional regulator [Gemmataceae bacterium]|jgi:DNA-binding GntR family transcriptional regulator|nr:GntR family transcriptional regulator [Gemmataceae bacterium]
MAAQLDNDRPVANGHAPPRAFLKDAAYDKIKLRLLNNDYPPGSFLSERQLADSLGMSKTPVKAALERLEAEGYISVSPQQGIVVRELSVQEIADQYEIRAALESYALRTVAGRLTPDQVSRVRANLKAQSKLRGTGNVPLGVELDAAFHALFVEFLGNREILKVTGQLGEKMQRVVTQVFRLSPGRIEASYEEHVAIANAVIDGRGDEAAGLIARHLELGKRLILSPRG